ncbi:hypothetical protein X777_08963 [Ooceraea biroi]|uniref:RHD domain-containing protein n=1 Tax=Ooceraea biroi TaxID=2015173 RepID=A0A026W8J6_OOCBI|nr:hypothetical protein X777_08963 [Ooceraea biroi]
MSISSSSPMHVMDDYINLNNASVTILGEPYINILVQPMEKFRFRYISEMVGTHGSLLGASTSRRRNKNNVPTVQLCNFPERAVIRCLLVTTDEDHRIPHAHRLVRRVGTDDVDDPHDIEVSSNNDFTAEFNSMGIIHTARKNVKDELVRKLRAEILEERRRLNINATLSVRDEAQIKADAEQYQKCINLNSVALCFQGFIKDQYGITRPITAPVYSNPINNLKSALTGELKICRIDKYTSSCEGGEEVFILVEKVSKKNIKIKFFELNDDDIEVWADYGRFSELDVHHQYAMVFRTPPYKDLNITTPREVFIQLERPSDSDCSEPIKFTYDAESFAKNIVIDILNNIKKKPTDAKNIIMNLLKDRTIYGDSPLHCALRFGQKDTVKRILMLMSTLNTDARDLTNIPNTSGKTPLHYAVLQNQPEITKALLMLCANPNIADHSGQMPLHTAANSIILYNNTISGPEAGMNVDVFITIIDVNKKNFSGNTALHNAVVTQGAKAKEICALLLKYGADPYIKNHNRPDVEETQVQNIKTEAHSEDDNMEECAGESSFDLASNKLDILQLISGQGDVSEKRGFVCKEENIVDTEKVWMDADQEKQLATILDETKGWKKLADHLNFDYLLKTFERNSFSSPALLLLNYIAVQTHISLGELQSILQNMGEEYAATYLQQVLSFN